MLICLFKFLSVKVEDTKLSECLVVACISLEYFLEVRNWCILILRVLLQCLAQTKVGVKRVWINLDGMLEILGSSLSFTKVGQQIGKMDATTKVIVIDGQTLFVVLHALLEVFVAFIAHAQVVESVGLWWPLTVVFDLDFDCLFKGHYSRLKFSELVQDFALEE